MSVNKHISYVGFVVEHKHVEYKPVFRQSCERVCVWVAGVQSDLVALFHTL